MKRDGEKQLLYSFPSFDGVETKFARQCAKIKLFTDEGVLSFQKKKIDFVWGEERSI